MTTVQPVEADVWRALSEVPDPELPVVNIVELGMVRGVTVEGGQVRVQFTPTFSGCPAVQVIRDDIRRAVAQLGASDVQVDTVISPPWSSADLHDSARRKLQQAGIAPPAPAPSGLDLIRLEAPPVACPHCGSTDTRVTSTFGSALCKRMYVCQHCREPFEGLKSL
ncbi:1,2-phenylacetyl-CoA epoxidase subunit PaaD [Deinococcus sonorensis]|uniref:1,2-phenylacetyl-CoA epoxidase subunit PaaD n=2 Tax=Deinococcus sonorensis TaxID=309891 RepID=A0AAU7UCR8_9DEIO